MTRIAVLPLDSRPANYQFPARLATIARAEALLPPRDLLGDLHRVADREPLLDWLVDVTQDAQAYVVSLDACVYGGLVASRSDMLQPLEIDVIEAALRHIDKRCAGYMYVVLPRLGTTTTSRDSLQMHVDLAAYFTAWGEADADPSDARSAHLRELEARLSPDAIARAWALRRRNFEMAKSAIELSARLGLRGCHFAVEDNAPAGPHLREIAELKQAANAVTAELGPRAPRYTFFDGADECASLLTARALLDAAGAPPQPVRLTLFPAAPGPERYIGLYESQTLESGLHFLSSYLGLSFRHAATAQWLVCYGKQPQPDAFAVGPGVFNNPYLLPAAIEGSEPLFVADLAACNGGNPHLAERLGELEGPAARLAGISAWNTNFNALGFSAATIAVSGLPNADREAQRKLLLERLADDYAYQSIARAEIVQRCRVLRLDPLDFSDATEGALTMLEHVCRQTWLAWAGGPAALLLREAGLADTAGVEAVRYAFPWRRAFESEVMDR